MVVNEFLRKCTNVVCLAVCGLSAAAQVDDVTIIPRPLELQRETGEFSLTPKVVIGYEDSLGEQAEYLRQVLGRSTGWDLTVKPGARKADIVLALSPEGRVPESYSLHVTPKKVTIDGSDTGGVFYGIQSLLQLFPTNVYNAVRQSGQAWTAPCVSITDAPERPWRGMMLDVARYFYDKDFVKKYIDMMAMYKLNKLQFHLIDDSGWRLEIKKYPRLTEVGAWAGPDDKRIGGYYTQDDIREIIDYARVHNVEIIPEIEFPAHILSAIVAYPWLSCTGEQHQVPDQHFISRDLLCVGKESSYKFLEDVLEETVALFPSHYINIGGDEAVYTRWEQCPDCQAVMKREGLTRASELQGYLTNVVLEMMKNKGRTVIGWEEIIQRGKLNEPVVALIWHNVADTIQATRSGHRAILTPATHMYLDFPESSTPGEVKAATWMPPISIEKCYGMDINDYTPESTVMGVQGCLWSDQFIHGTQLQEIAPIDENRSERYAEYMTFPRLLAVSEVAWSPRSQRDYADFSRRLASHYSRLDNKDCGYRVPEPHIISMTSKAGGVEFTLAPSVDGAEIRYTVNGRYPTVHSPLYQHPVTVDRKEDFHAITVVTPRHYSLPIYFAPDYSAYKQYGTYTAEWQSLEIQTKPSAWRFDCTGKISGNGTYEVSFVRTKGTNALRLGGMKLLKRDETLVSQTAEGSAAPVMTYTFQVDAFEAGTPFYIEVVACGDGGNDTSGLVFIKRK